MFDYHSSTIFIDQILKRMEESVKTSSVSETVLKCKETCVKEDVPNREKLVLKFTRCNLKVKEKKVKWKVSIPAGLKNDKVELNYNRIKTASADKDIIINLDDIFNPLSEESREKMRRLKQNEMDQVLRLGRFENECEPENKTEKSKYPSTDELLTTCKSIPCLSNYKNSFKQYINNMAGFAKCSRNNREKENKINFYSNQMNEAVICSNYEPKRNSKTITMKRKLDITSLKLKSGRESFEGGDLGRPYKKRRVFKQQKKLNRKNKNYTNDQKSNKTDWTCREKMRPNYINHGFISSNRRSERLRKKRMNKKNH